MVSKLTGFLALLAATLFTIPVYAAASAVPAAHTTAVQTQVPLQAEVKSPPVPFADQNPEPAKPSQHSEVSFGSAAGHLLSTAVPQLHKDDKMTLANRLSVRPSISKERTGVSISYKF